MRIGIETSGILDTLGLDAGFAAIKNAGFEVVDFFLGHYLVYKEEMDESYLEELFEEERITKYFQEVKETAKKYGIKIGQCHAPGQSYVPRKEREDKIMKKMIHKCIELCAYLECTHLVVHPVCDGSARFPTLTKEQEYEMNIEMYSSFIPDLKKYHVTCCLENMYSIDWGTKRSYFSSCSDMNEAVYYLDTLNEMAGEKCFAFCADIGHMIMLGIEPCYAFEKLGNRLEILHIHDNDGMHDDHTAPYLGVVNWKRFIKALRDNGYRGDLSFEVSSFSRKFPKEVVPDAIKLIASTGRYFREQILAEE